MAGKHWSFEDDEFLASFYEAVGDYIGEHDLGRPKGAATRRVAFLKISGAWDALARMQHAQNRGNIEALRAELDYAKAAGWQVEETGCTVEQAEVPAELYDGDYPWRRDMGDDGEIPSASSHELADIVREAVSNHNDVDGVAWRLVACEIAKTFGIILTDVVPQTGLPRDLSGKGAMA